MMGLPIVIEKIKTMWLTEPNFTPEDLVTIKAPTLIMQGQNNEVIRPDHGESIAKAIPNAEFILLLGAGHDAMTRKAEDWNNTVLAFLKDK
jgi:pimeloyl-ACP methyl ester carboxylesterase